MLRNQQEVNDLVVKPTDNYHGRSYSDLVKEFIQWLLQYDPDNQSLKDVIFLRGIDFHGYSSYSHRFVKIGNDALQVYSDQAIFITVITSFADRVHHHLETPEKRKDYVNQLIQMGDDPPSNNQVTIDGLHPEIQMSDHKVITDDFTIQVPEPLEGKTLGQILDVPFNIPGPTEVVAGGYFILLKPLEVGKHIIGYFGNGDFGYRNQTLVELDVVPRGTLILKPTMHPGEMKALKSIVESKINAGEITNQEDYYKVLSSLEASENEIEKIKARSEKQIGEFSTQTKEQTALIERFAKKQHFKTKLEFRKLIQKINELGLEITEGELLEMLDMETKQK
ncbi:MAG TPA: hypothetical protein VK250_09215 [Nitrososphaeraceae archaeon]|nr:hypothetical protein [Nitrososphaeraceae archaeon]